MPNVNGEKFPYTKEGKKRAVAAAKAAGKTNLPARVGETGKRQNMPARVGETGKRQNLAGRPAAAPKRSFTAPGQRQQTKMTGRPKQDEKY